MLAVLYLMSTILFSVNADEICIPAVEAGDPLSGQSGAFIFGLQFTCLLTDEGKTKCWGHNKEASLGIGNLEDQGDDDGEMENLPETLWSQTPKYTDANLGTSIVALLPTGDVEVTGPNYKGIYCAGDKVMRDEPYQVDLGDRKAKTVYAANHYACMLSTADEYICWGANDKGQLGLGHMNHVGDEPNQCGNNLVPVDLGSVAVKDHYLGTVYQCATFVNDRIKCWGSNKFGKLGYGTGFSDNYNWGSKAGQMGDNLDFVDTGAHVAKELFLMDGNTCMWTTENKAVCWGRVFWGQLGLGLSQAELGMGEYQGDAGNEMGNHLQAVDFGSYNGSPRYIEDMDCGLQHCCALLNDKSVVCWGHCLHFACGVEEEDIGLTTDQVGDNFLPVDFSYMPEITPGESRYPTELHCGYYHCCVFLDGDSALACWGAGTHGALGVDPASLPKTARNVPGSAFPLLIQTPGTPAQPCEAEATTAPTTTIEAVAGYTGTAEKCVIGENIRKLKNKSAAECAQACTDHGSKCVGFELFNDYGGRKGKYVAGDCNLSSSTDTRDCNGRHYNLDFYSKNADVLGIHPALDKLLSWSQSVKLTASVPCADFGWLEGCDGSVSEAIPTNEDVIKFASAVIADYYTLEGFQVNLDVVDE